MSARLITRSVGALLLALATGQAARGGQQEPAAATQERQLGERQRELSGHHSLSGLGRRGPERLAPEATQIDPATARAQALALYENRGIAVAAAAALRAAPTPASTPTRIATVPIDPPTLGYAMIALLALCGLFFRTRRHRVRVVVTSAFDRVSEAPSGRALR